MNMKNFPSVKKLQARCNTFKSRNWLLDQLTGLGVSIEFEEMYPDVWIPDGIGPFRTTSHELLGGYCYVSPETFLKLVKRDLGLPLDTINPNELIISLREEVEALKARVKELEPEPKQAWWEQYKVGDKIDIIGVEITKIDNSTASEYARIAINGVTGHSQNWVWLDDRNIQPHQSNK